MGRCPRLKKMGTAKGLGLRHLRLNCYVGSAPGAFCGMMYYDHDESQFKYYNGSAWLKLCFCIPPAPARYWRYTFWGCGCTSPPQQRLLNDFKLIDTGSADRAAGVTPTGTPNVTLDGAYGNTTDGNTGTYWQGYNENTCRQYLEFDLGASYTICKLCSLSCYNSTYYTRYVCLSYCTGAGWCDVINCYGASASALCNITFSM